MLGFLVFCQEGADLFKQSPGILLLLQVSRKSHPFQASHAYGIVLSPKRGAYGHDLPQQLLHPERLENEIALFQCSSWVRL